MEIQQLEQPVPVFDNCLGKNSKTNTNTLTTQTTITPCIFSQVLVFPLTSIASCAPLRRVCLYLLHTVPSEGCTQKSRSGPGPNLPQDEQALFPQPLPIGQLVNLFHQPSSPSHLPSLNNKPTFSSTFLLQLMYLTEAICVALHIPFLV